MAAFARTDGWLRWASDELILWGPGEKLSWGDRPTIDHAGALAQAATISAAVDVALAAALGLLAGSASIAAIARGNVLLACVMDAETASEMIGTTAFVAAMESGAMEIAYAADIELRSL